MKRRRQVDEVETRDKHDDTFYEAMPLAERQYYRDTPVVIDREDDRPGLSGLAMLALVIAAIVIFLMVAGALSGLREANRTELPTPMPDNAIPTTPNNP